MKEDDEVPGPSGDYVCFGPFVNARELKKEITGQRTDCTIHYGFR